MTEGTASSRTDCAGQLLRYGGRRTLAPRGCLRLVLLSFQVQLVSDFRPLAAELFHLHTPGCKTKRGELAYNFCALML